MATKDVLESNWIMYIQSIVAKFYINVISCFPSVTFIPNNPPDIANISDMDLTIYFSGVNVCLPENVCNELKDLNSDIKIVVEKSLAHNSVTKYNILAK